MLRTAALLACAGACLGAKGVVDGTDKNFKDVVLSLEKNSFVKFLAPWCGHCKSLKPDWDKLGKAYPADGNVQIVDVDCTTDGKQVCSQMGVQGFPTIKYFTDKTGKKGMDYQGGRDFNSLKQFVDKTLNTAKCDPKTGKDCSKQEKTYIEKIAAKSAEERASELAEKETELKTIKKEKKEAQDELKAKEKEWTKKEKLLSKAVGLLKAFDTPEKGSKKKK